MTTDKYLENSCDDCIFRDYCDKITGVHANEQEAAEAALCTRLTKEEANLEPEELLARLQKELNIKELDNKIEVLEQRLWKLKEKEESGQGFLEIERESLYNACVDLYKERDKLLKEM